jgi:dTDP-4-amino-4,6-dideoxygalactose transaminase
MRVPFLDLRAEHAPVLDELYSAIGEVLESGVFVGGEQVLALERELGDHLRVRHVISVNSGTDALRLALEGLGIGAGDEVIVPTYTFVATAAAVKLAGARPVFVDSGIDSFLIDVEGIEAAITPRTRAIVPVHLFGQAAAMDEILALAKHRGLLVLEDAAQAFGARYRDKTAGTLGDAGAFSFYPSKILGGLGDGGSIVTNDSALAAKLRRLRNHGRQSHGCHLEVGHNSRLDALQAAALRVKLRRVDAWDARRREIAAIYRRGLAGVPVVLPPTEQTSFNHFVIRASGRDRLKTWLADRGVESAIYYPVPCHRQPAFAADLTASTFPAAEHLAQIALALPLYPSLPEASAIHVCELVREFFNSGHEP